MPRITVTSVLVDDQDRALTFYTDVLGFEKKDDQPMGEYRWLTVVSPDDPDGAAVLLEPDALPAAKTWQKALKDEGIPITLFEVDDVAAEHARLAGLGVRVQEPQQMGDVKFLLLDDTCGNLVQLVEKN